MAACGRQFENRAAEQLGASNVFAIVATILTDAFFHGDNTGSNPVGDANKESARYDHFR